MFALGAILTAPVVVYHDFNQTCNKQALLGMALCQMCMCIVLALANNSHRVLPL